METTFIIDNAIGIFNKILSEEHCKSLINTYEKDVVNNLAITRIQQEGSFKDTKEDTSVFYIANNNWDDNLQKACNSIKDCVHLYERETSFMRFSSINNLHFTGVKIQKTLPGQGYHIWHIEKELYSYQCNRALVFTIYLNDVEEGGETEFLIQKKRISPTTGTIVIFPAHYPYVHRGNPPLNKEKYLLTSWLLGTK
jgi:hypothetical protein